MWVDVVGDRRGCWERTSVSQRRRSGDTVYGGVYKRMMSFMEMLEGYRAVRMAVCV